MFKPVFRLLLAALLSSSAFVAKAQQFGGNPSAIKWNQVNTPAARIIFPVGLDSAGYRVASIIQQINNRIKPTIGYKQKQINVVLQNQLITTNGYVGLAPFRSEFYLIPAQNSFSLGSLSIADQLAIHEFRHVQQYNNSDVGLTRFLHVLFGEGGQQLAYGLAVPNWFAEGDAVFNETLLTDQGRGRLPYFFNGYRSLWAAGKNYSWMKLRNGSYVDYVPDWYPLGYMLVAYGRDTYGNDVWKKINNRAASYQSFIYPFQNAVKTYTGKDYATFRTSALNYFKKQLITRQLEQGAQKYKTNQHFIANQEFPAYVDDETIIYRKSSYKQRPAFIMRKGNTERRIRLSDFTVDGYFTYNNGEIVYASRRPDLRWGYREFNEIKIIDVKTGAQRKVTTKTKYFAPAFNANNSRIVAVDAQPSGKYALHVLNAADGKLISSIPNPQNLYYTYPKFYTENQIVAAIRKGDGKMSVALIDVATGQVDDLSPASIAPKAFPVVKNDTVYFTGTSGVNDKLFAVSVKDRKLFELQSDSLQSYIGNYQPAVSANNVAWVSFSAYGYQLHEVAKGSLTKQVVTALPQLPDFNIASLQRDSSANLLSTVNTEVLPLKKYPKFTRPFNFHSLIPYFDDPEYSFSLVGENILNTFQSELSLTYNRNEGYKQFGFTSTYGALFPYLFGSVNYTLDRRDYGFDRNRNPVEVNWNETQVQAGLQVPLNLSQGRNYTRFNIVSSINYSINDVKQAAFKNALPNNTYLNNSITFSNQIAAPVQHIYPHLAQNITLTYRNTINSLNAHQLLASGTFYFPGLFTNHSLVFNIAHQRRDRNYSIFSNQLPFSRGYTSDNLYRLYKAGANYHFPIAYPDAGFANLVYLLRLRGNIFYDYTHGTDFYTNGTNFKADFRSAGAELFFDTQWFNESRITFGLRYTYLLDRDIFGGAGSNRFTLILPLNIF
ncbi:hypothetical protein MUGA111182_20240 [Mucilaginibacter galii]|uniref:Uncharacterized protein n=1 Tax=Mucilaginibacter galii TaxID=2005073 RepID=A0A917J7B4_9SPHI|nr:hypothetical protein [Mucilaginibacter galii]GGI50470.1 hypothetical protein GCM10011425_16820 [Mucilaginibacter galii]